MLKKMTLLAMAVGALVAFAIPAAASAAQLTNEKEELIGGTISATSTNTVTNLDNGGVLECAHVEIHGIVEQNNGTVVVAMDGANDTATGCKFNGSNVTIIPTFEGLSGTGSGPGTAAFSFNVGPGLCTQKSVAPSTVTWNGTSTIHIESRVAGGCGEGTLSGDFVVSNSEGEVIVEN